MTENWSDTPDISEVSWRIVACGGAGTYETVKTGSSSDGDLSIVIGNGLVLRMSNILCGQCLSVG